MQVAQHIYSNVPKEQSPQRKRGYQTLFYTKDALSRSEVFSLEERTQYYTSDENPVKWQFHRLGEHAVITRTVPLLKRDEFGRQGRYLSHSLVLSADQFAQLKQNPFLLIADDWFFDDLAAVFEMGQPSGNIPPLSVQEDWSQPERAIRIASQWSQAERNKLLTAGWSARQLAQTQTPVTLQGNTTTQLETLTLLFLLTQPDKRADLTFDTYALECDWRTSSWPFWGWGGVSASSITIDCDHRRVSGDISAIENTPFENWVLDGKGLRSFNQHKQDAWLLSDVLLGATANIDTIDARFGRQFCEVNLAQAAQRVLDAIPLAFSAELQSRLKTYINRESWRWVQWAVSQPNDSQVADWLADWVASEIGRGVGSADYKALVQFAQQTEHDLLFAFTQLQNQKLADLEKMLETLSPRDYRFVAELACSENVVSPEAVFSLTHADQWAQRYARGLSEGGLKAVLKRAKKDESFDYDLLLPLVEELSAETLTKWEKRSRKQDAPRLRRALEPYYKASPMERLRGLWRRGGEDE